MFKISFDFDETTHQISNIKVVSNTKVNLEGDEALVQLMENKIKISPKAVAAIGAQPGDRITINYWTEDNHNTFPLIGKSEVFTDKEGGCKLTKLNTVSFRGTQNTTLKVYGNLFKLEEFKDGMFKLVKVEDKNDSIENEQLELDNLNSSEIDEEIKTMADTDDLPF